MNTSNTVSLTYIWPFVMLCCLALLVSCAQSTTSMPEEIVVTATFTPVAAATEGPTPLIAPTPISAPLSCVRGALQAEEEVIIGALYPLSNPIMMVNGFAMQAATNLAVTDINAQGGIDGRPLRIIVYDTGSSPAQGALFAERLITMDCVAAIIGVFHSDVALAVRDIAVQYHVPVVFADPFADEITAVQDEEIFRIAPTHSMLLDSLGQWLQTVGDLNQDGEICVVTLVENTPYGQGRLQRFEETLPQLGIQFAGFPLDLPANDFSPVIARIVALDRSPDVILLYLHNGEVIPLYQQLTAAGIGPKRNTLLVTTNKILDDKLFWQAVPDGQYAIAMHIGPWPSTVTPMGRLFAQKFLQYFQRWPEASAFEAYDATWLIADAIRRAGTLSPDAVINALEETDITLASGHYTFPYGTRNPPDGVTVPAYLWHQWPESPFLYLQYTEKNQPATEMAVIWPPTYQTVDSLLIPGLVGQSKLSQ